METGHITDIWDRVVGVQPDPSLWLVIATGVLALGAVVPHSLWRLSRKLLINHPQKRPLYNAVVYVPNAPLDPIKHGPKCDSCGGASISGKPIVTRIKASVP